MMRACRRLFFGLAVAVAATGCHRDMWTQHKVKAYAESAFYADGLSARQPIAHTVARGHLTIDDAMYAGKVGTKYVEKFPFPIGEEDLKIGQTKFNTFCSPCHGRIGDGQGMVAQRGFALRKQPADYHIERLRKAAPGYFFETITNGFGLMYPYGPRIKPEDRWRIVAYVRVLQFSQNAKASDLTAEDLKKVQEANQTAATGGTNSEAHE